MCGGGNLGGSGTGNVPVVAKALPVKNSKNQNQLPSKMANTSGKDSQLPITVG